MTSSRWERLAPLTGAVAIALEVAGAALAGFVGGTFPPSAAAIVEYLEEGPVRIGVGAYLGWVGVGFLLWFMGSLRHSLRTVEGGTGRLSAVGFGGGVAAATSLVAAYSALAGAAARAGSSEGIGPDAAAALYDVYGNLGAVTGIGLAVVVAATAVVSFRTRFFPRWFVWVSAVLALGLISPLLYLFVPVGFLWILVVSVWLYLQGRTAGA